MPRNSAYTSKTPDKDGQYSYTPEEHAIWAKLFDRQITRLQDCACNAYLDGVQALKLQPDGIPQVKSLDARLATLTGAGVKGVDAIIPQAEFSALLANRTFPVATFIRRREDIDYIKEPDIFHEVFGHAPMLTNDAFCQFLERFGRLAITLPRSHIKHLYRLFWFTVEFGMIREAGQLKTFGAGIMSSPAEAEFAQSDAAEHIDFDLLTALRTDYRIDIVQPVYFVIDSFEQLAGVLDVNIRAAIDDAQRLGDLPNRFEAAA